MMDGLATKSREDGVAVETKPTKIGGFSGVVGPEADNKEVNLVSLEGQELDHNQIIVYKLKTYR